MPDTFPVLLVDDDAVVADLLIRAAEQQFPEALITHAGTFQEAADHLKNVEKEETRLILLDVDLKDTSTGLDFLRMARNHEKGRVIPVVMLTVNSAPETVQQAYELGAAAFTHKPFTFGQWKEYAAILRQYWFSTVTVPDPPKEKPGQKWLFRHKSAE